MDHIILDCGYKCWGFCTASCNNFWDTAMHAQDIICNYSSLPFSAALCLFLIWLIIHVLQANEDFSCCHLIDITSFSYLNFRTTMVALLEGKRKGKLSCFTMPCLLRFVGYHGEVQSVENVYWNKEELRFWISFQTNHCPKFQIILEKICGSPGVVSCGGSEAPFLDAWVFWLPIIFHYYCYYYFWVQKKNLVVLSNNRWFKQIT